MKSKIYHLLSLIYLYNIKDLNICTKKIQQNGHLGIVHIIDIQLWNISKKH